MRKNFLVINVERFLTTRSSNEWGFPGHYWGKIFCQYSISTVVTRKGFLGIILAMREDFLPVIPSASIN
jgi:hypothetical protein